VTYHPAYLLRTPGDKRKAWEDLKFARSVFRDSPQPKVTQILMATAPELLDAVPDVLIRPMSESDVSDVIAVERASYQFRGAKASSETASGSVTSAAS